MSKQSIFVKHKDEIFNKLIETLENMPSDGIHPVGHHSAYGTGYKNALKWVLSLDKTQEQKDQEFSDKIDELTNKGE
jgi:hypothetical protein